MSDTGYLFEKTSLSLKQNTTRKRAARNWNGKCCIFRIPWRSEFSPIELLKGVADRLTKAMCLRSRHSNRVSSSVPRRSSNRVSSSSIGRSKTIGASVDYYRTAAVEDCIEFIHSSFSRSNSLATTPRQEFMHTSVRKLDS